MNRKSKLPPMEPSLETLRFFQEFVKRTPRGAAGTRFATMGQLAKDMPYATSFVFRKLQEIRELYARPLFNRATHRLTDDGKKIHQYADSVLAAHAAGKHWPIEYRKQVIIGTNNRSLHFVLPGVIAAYLQREKGAKQRRYAIDLRFREYEFEQMIDELRRGEIHAGIFGVPFDGHWRTVSHRVIWKGVGTVMIAAAGGGPDPRVFPSTKGMPGGGGHTKALPTHNSLRSPRPRSLTPAAGAWCVIGRLDFGQSADSIPKTGQNIRKTGCSKVEAWFGKNEKKRGPDADKIGPVSALRVQCNVNDGSLLTPSKDACCNANVTQVRHKQNMPFSA